MIRRWRGVLVVWLFTGIGAALTRADGLPAPGPVVPQGTELPAASPLPQGGVKASPPPPAGVVDAGGLPGPGPGIVTGFPPNQISLLYPAPLRCTGNPSLASALEDRCTPFWVTGEYLVLWIKDGPNSQPLLTTGTPTTPVVGGLGGATTDTQVLYGGTNLKYPAFSGFRGAFGFALSDHSAVEVNGFVTEEQAVGYLRTSDPVGNQALFRPFFAVTTAGITPSVAAVSNPGAQAGAFSARSASQIWGAEANWLEGALPPSNPGLTWIAGISYRQLNEDIGLTDMYYSVGGNPIFFRGFPSANGDVVVQDRFLTTNWFLGGQVGASQRWTFGPAFIEVKGLFALGSTQQQVTVSGTTTFLTGPNLATREMNNGGLLAQGSNIGTLEKSRFTVIPSGDVKGGWFVTRWMIATVGYTGMYWSSVARPGDQINRIINVTQVPSLATFVPNPEGPVQPKPIIRSTDFWANGLTVGLELRF